HNFVHYIQCTNIIFLQELHINLSGFLGEYYCQRFVYG
ncbi:MAG: hypothetical protein ACI93P_002328, partial [bacterium]